MAAAWTVWFILISFGATTVGAQSADNSGASTETNTTLVVANRNSLSDIGTAASMVAAGLGEAVVFADSTRTLGAGSATLMSQQQPAHVWLVGGTAALSVAIENELKRLSPGVRLERLAGNDRIHTAALAGVRVLDDSGSGVVVLANGWSLSDVGTAASAVASGRADAVLYVSADDLGQPTRELIAQHELRQILVVGGTTAISSTVADQAQDAGGTVPQRIGGTTRVETAAISARRALEADARTVVLANGWSLTDVGIAATLAAGLKNSAVLYTERSALGSATAQILGDHQPSQIYLVDAAGLLDSVILAEVNRHAPAAAVSVVSSSSDGSYFALGLETPHQFEADDVLPVSSRFASVSAGRDHTCAIRTDRTVICWGSNRYGQLDAPGGEFIAVSAALFHTCGLRADGTAACWGRNESGQSTSPGGAFVQITLGTLHSCGLRAAGEVTCWGDNRQMQTSAPNERFSEVSAGQYHTCGITADGRLECWGANGHGQSEPPEGTFVSVASGGSADSNHSCAMRSDASLVCWGSNVYTELGRGGSRRGGQIDAPGGAFTSISAGGFHTCGLRPDSTATCWGYRHNGSTAVPVGQFSAIAAGGEHTCGLRPNGAIRCWGSQGLYDYGQATSPSQAQLAEAIPPFKELVPGNGYLCGTTIDNQIVCWGAGPGAPLWSQPKRSGTEQARLDLNVPVNSSLTCSRSPNGILDCWNSEGELWPLEPDGISDFADMSENLHYRCGVRQSGSLHCWLNDRGGFPSYDDLSIPAGHFNVSEGVLSPPTGEFTAVQLGRRDFSVSSRQWACALGVDSRISCWGEHIGDRAETPDAQFSTFALGDAFGCGITTSSEVACWNLSPEDSLDEPHEMVANAPAGKFVDIRSAGASEEHMCATRIDSGITCWQVYRLLSGQEETRTFVSDDAIEQYSLWNDYGCGITADHRIQCWGGHPATFAAAQIGIPEGEFSQVVAAGGTPCARRLDGTVTCWGLYVDRLSAYDGEFSDIHFAPVGAGQPANYCGLRFDGTVQCWNNRSHIANFTDKERYYYENVPAWQTGGSIRSISAGVEHVCAVRTKGTVDCWGSNSYGTLDSPRDSFTQIAAGNDITCGIRRDRSVTCWGADADSLAAPSQGEFSSISVGGAGWAGTSHVCGLRPSGTVECWGSDSHGETQASEGTFIQVETGPGISCGLREVGSVECWGLNESDGAEQYGDVTILQPPDATFVSISVAKHLPYSWQYHACGLTHDGAIVCWGSHQSERRGHREGQFVSVVAGSRFECGLKADGSVNCWGEEDSGRTRTNVSFIREYEPAGTFTEISAAGHHVCALRSDSALVCWGSLALLAY